MADKVKVLELAYHRNGVSGEGFYAARVKDPGGVKLAVLFYDPETGEGGERCAVLDPALPTVEFGVNSWRGDHYADAIIAAIRERWPV